MQMHGSCVLDCACLHGYLHVFLKVPIESRFFVWSVSALSNERACFDLCAGANAVQSLLLRFEQVSSFRCQHPILYGKQSKPHATV